MHPPGITLSTRQGGIYIYNVVIKQTYISKKLSVIYRYIYFTGHLCRIQVIENAKRYFLLFYICVLIKFSFCSVKRHLLKPSYYFFLHSVEKASCEVMTLLFYLILSLESLMLKKFLFMSWWQKLFSIIFLIKKKTKKTIILFKTKEKKQLCGYDGFIIF